MKEKLEKIDLIRERANVSYQDAKEALERNEYDIVETLIDLERQDRLKHECDTADKEPTSKGNASTNHEEKKSTASEHGISQSIKELFRKSMRSSFILKDKNQEQVLKLPLLIAALLFLFTLPFSLIILIVALVFKYKIIIRHEDGKSTCVNQIIDDLNVEYDSRKEDKKTPADSEQDIKDAEYKIKYDK